MPRSLLLLGFAFLAGFSSFAQAAEELEKELLSSARYVLKTARAAGHKNIGLVKFRVQFGDGTPTEVAGSLNSRLATKFELALIMANQGKNPLGIVTDVQQTALVIPEANHLTAEGRRAYFRIQYPLFWGEERVTPDILLSGIASVSQDLKTMRVGFLRFDQNDSGLKLVDDFYVPLNVENLTDLGESFALPTAHEPRELERKAADRHISAADEALAAITETKKPENQRPPLLPRLHPLAADNPTAQVSLEVYYDGELQTLTYKDGVASLPRPPRGKPVTFTVRRLPENKQRLGVVVKVNGMSTISRETLPDVACAPWVMKPQVHELAIPGFQMDKKTVELIEFPSLKSLSSNPNTRRTAESISLTVFAERRTLHEEPTLSEDGEVLEAIQNAAFPEARAQSLAALQTQLLPNYGPRCLPPPWVEDLLFERDPLPLFTATIRFEEK